MFSRKFLFPSLFRQIKNFTVFNTKVVIKEQDLCRECDVGVCVRVHFHFKKPDINSYPNYIKDQINLNQNTVEEDTLAIASTDKEVKILMAENDENGPDFISLCINMELENPNGEINPNQAFVENINIGGKIKFSRAINDNIFIYNAKGNCNVKCNQKLRTN